MVGERMRCEGRAFTRKSRTMTPVFLALQAMKRHAQLRGVAQLPGTAASAILMAVATAFVSRHGNTGVANIRIEYILLAGFRRTKFLRPLAGIGSECLLPECHNG